MNARILLISKDQKQIEFFIKTLDEFIITTNSSNFQEINLILIQAEMALPEFLHKLTIHNIPIIIILKEIDYTQFKILLSLGVSDYLTYPLQKEDIKARIALHNIHNNFIQSNRDSFTGLYNKHYFYIKIDALILNSVRYYRPLSLIFIDLDLFKKTNDDYGHIEGDKLLKEFATIIQSSIRNEDILSRFGGDEFTLLLPNTNNKQAILVAQRIRKEIEAKKLGNTASFGVASFRRGDSVENFVNRADKALYIAKSEGGNTVVTIQS